MDTKRVTQTKALISLGTMHVKQGRLEAGIEAYIAALEIDSKDAATFNNLGGAFYSADRVPEAIAAFLAAIQLRPDYAKAHVNLASILVSIGETRGAAEHFAQALKYSAPDSSIAALAREQLTRLQGENREDSRVGSP